MTGGLGAGFLTLTLSVVLAGFTLALGLTAAAAIAIRRRTGWVPAAAAYVATVLVLGVVVIAGFGVLVLANESAVGAALLVAIVFAPIASVVTLRRTDGWIRRAAAAGFAWSGPYLFGIAVFWGINIAVPPLVGLAPSEVRPAGVGWMAAATAGAVAVLGALLLSDRMARLLLVG